ncbi:MAG: allophanate hydrolase [Mycobacteriales bacterium]
MTAAQAAGRPVFTQPLNDSQLAGFAAASPPGPLSGVSFALKDNLDLAGLPTTAGCPLLEQGPPAATSATAVQRLLDAGAVPVGKTNLDQFATGLVGSRSPYGRCSSVYDSSRISGGSSSGSAVAVAKGIVPLALGTDTAGSGRVPAAFNGLVGMKPTRGIVSTRGLMPACRSLDVVTTLTRTVAEARQALAVLVFDDEDAWSRQVPAELPTIVAAQARVVAVPGGPLDLDPEHQVAWDAAVAHLATVVPHVVRVDVSAFLLAAKLLYEGPWVAERYAAFGHLLEPAGPHLDPIVRTIVLGGRDLLAADAFRGADRLAQFRRQTEPLWLDVDALMLPVTPGHPTHDELDADPFGVNARMGTYTNFVNLLDLAAIAVPAGSRPDGLPFGVQFVSPAFSDAPLMNLGSAWCGEFVPPPSPAQGRVEIAVAGAHLSGLPLNAQLVRLGGRLARRDRTSASYRMVRLPGPGLPRPALLAGGSDAFPVEVWDLPAQGLGCLADAVPAPLGLGRVTLSGDTEVMGFICADGGATGGLDIGSAGGWRTHVRTA